MSHLQVSDRLSETSVANNILRCLTSEKSQGLNYTAMENLKSHVSVCYLETRLLKLHVNMPDCQSLHYFDILHVMYVAVTGIFTVHIP